MGVPAEPADSREAIGAAVQRALGRDGPSLIEIRSAEAHRRRRG
jgi:hypothetical protein